MSQLGGRGDDLILQVGFLLGISAPVVGTPVGSGGDFLGEIVIAGNSDLPQF